MKEWLALPVQAGRKCLLHHYLEDRHRAEWHRSVASESEECALRHSNVSYPAKKAGQEKPPTPYHSCPAFFSGWETFESGVEHILRFR